MTDRNASSPSRATELPMRDPGIETGSKERPAPQKTIPRRALVLIVPLCVALGGIIGLYFQPPTLRAFFSITGLEPGGGTSTPIAVAIERVSAGEEVSVLSEGDVVALGRLIPRGNVAVVSTPFGASDARIETIDVSVGDLVSRGDVIAVLDNLSQLQATVELAEANLRVREASLARARIDARASLEEAQASLSRAETTAAAALSELDRVTSMLERGVTTRANFDAVQSVADQAIRDVERARATLSRFTTDGDAVQADIAVAEADVAAARAEAKRADADLQRAFVRSPIDGQILEIHVRPGERPGADGVANVGDTSRMTAELELFQTMIRQVSLGDRVTLTSRALPQELSGTVSSIGLEIGRQSIVDDDPAAKTDARVVNVIVELDGPSSDAAATFTNLEVIARIDADPSR